MDLQVRLLGIHFLPTWAPKYTLCNLSALIIVIIVIIAIIVIIIIVEIY